MMIDRMHARNIKGRGNTQDGQGGRIGDERIGSSITVVIK